MPAPAPQQPSWSLFSHPSSAPCPAGWRPWPCCHHCSSSQHHHQLLENILQSLPGWLWGSSVNSWEMWNPVGGKGQAWLPKQVLPELWHLKAGTGPACCSAISCLAETKKKKINQQIKWIIQTQQLGQESLSLSLHMQTFFFLWMLSLRLAI